MNKSLLVASFAMLTASVFGMNPNYHGESSSKSSHNQLLRDVKQENLGNEHVASENRGENIQVNGNTGNNLIGLMTQVLNQNQSSKREIQKMNREIQNLRNKLASEYCANVKLSEKLRESQNSNRRLAKINNNLIIFDNRRSDNSRKRSYSAGEEQLQREFELADLYKLRKVIHKKDKTISEYRKKWETLESENQKLKAENQVKDEKIANITKQFENSQNNEKDLKRKLDEANQEINNLKKQRSLKVFDGEFLDALENSEIDLSKYGSFPNLEGLIIRADQLSDILRYKPDLSRVTLLDIWARSTESLQTSQLSALFQLAPNTKELDLRNCYLTSLPKEIGNLKNLRELSVGFNDLTSIPKEIGNLKKLEYLHLHENKLTELPAEIYALPKLEELHLEFNPLKKLSKEDFASDVKIYQ